MANTHSIDLESGSSQYLSKTTPTGLPIGSGSRTIEAWVKFESLPGTGATMFLFNTGDEGTNDSEFSLTVIESSGSYYGYCDYYNRATTGTVDLGLSIGTWIHIAVTYDGTDLRYYINGVLKDTVADGGTVNTVNTIMAIGARGSLATAINFFDGLIDDVRVWNDVRTANEILVNMDTELVGTEANLQGYWKLNNDLLDETSNNNDLTNNNTAVFSTDASFMDRSIDLEETSAQYLSTPDSALLSVTGDFTIECQVKFESITTDPVWAAKWDVSNESFLLQMLSSNNLRAIMTSDGSTDVASTQIAWTPTLGTWYHIAAVYDASAGSIEWFIDSSSIGTSTGLPTSIYDGTASFYIGTSNYGGVKTNLFDGLIDEVRFWNDIRTSTEISDNKGTEIANDTAGLVGYWKLENNYIDSSGNGNLLTPQASPVFSIDEGWVSVGFTLVADLGTFALTGINAGLTRTRILVALVGSFVLTGIDTALTRALKMAASVGSFVLTGIDAVLAFGFTMVAETSSFILTGISTGFIRTLKTIASVGSFILTGIAITLTKKGRSPDKPIVSIDNLNKTPKVTIIKSESKPKASI